MMNQWRHGCYMASVVLLGLGVAGAAGAITTVPEIDPASGVNAVALLGGALLLVRWQRRRP